jgi:hypothetical protein
VPGHGGAIQLASGNVYLAIALRNGGAGLADHEGGRRTIGRFGIAPWEEVEGERAEAVRYWNVDLDDPRER